MHVKQPHNALKQILNVIPKNSFYQGVNNSERLERTIGMLGFFCKFSGILGCRIEKFCGFFGIFSEFHYLGYFEISLKICANFYRFFDISTVLLEIWDSLFLAERTKIFGVIFPSVLYT